MCHNLAHHSTRLSKTRLRLPLNVTITTITYNTGLIGTVHSGVNNCKIIRSLLGELCGINASQFNTDTPLIVGLKRVFPSQLNTTSY